MERSRYVTKGGGGGRGGAVVFSIYIKEGEKG